MNSNLHLNDLLLPIGIMNVISILPLLLLAPLMELVTTCYLSMDKTPLVPSKVISKFWFSPPRFTPARSYWCTYNRNV